MQIYSRDSRRRTDGRLTAATDTCSYRDVATTDCERRAAGRHMGLIFERQTRNYHYQIVADGVQLPTSESLASSVGGRLYFTNQLTPGFRQSSLPILLSEIPTTTSIS